MNFTTAAAHEIREQLLLHREQGTLPTILPVILDGLHTYSPRKRSHVMQYMYLQIHFFSDDNPQDVLSGCIIAEWAAQHGHKELFMACIRILKSIDAWEIIVKHPRTAWWPDLWRKRPQLDSIKPYIPALMLSNYHVLTCMYERTDYSKEQNEFLRLIVDNQQYADSWLWITLSPKEHKWLQTCARQESDRRRFAHRILLMIQLWGRPKSKLHRRKPDPEIVSTFELLKRLPDDLRIKIIEMITGLRLRGAIDKSDIAWLKRTE